MLKNKYFCFNEPFVKIELMFLQNELDVKIIIYPIQSKFIVILVK